MVFATRTHVLLSLVTVLAATCLLVLQNASGTLGNLKMTAVDNSTGRYLRPGITAAEVLRARGFIARDYYFTTPDGYILHIVRGTNPLVNKGRRGLKHKYPLLLLHGATVSSASFLINSAKARPKNFAHLNTRKMTLKQLIKRVGKDPSAWSMPLLALNFGYEVWLLDRRGYMSSRHKLGHLKRTAVDALKAIPYTLFGNAISGFSFIGGMIPGRPHKLTTTGKGRRRKKRRATSLLERLINAVLVPRILSPQQSAEEKLLQFVEPLMSFPEALTSRGMLLKEAINTFDPEYWNFSFDEQVEYDLPSTIDFILAKTGHRKVHVVTLSCSGAVILLSLANKPRLANKVARVVNWAPAVTLGSETDNVYLLGYLGPILQPYIGPLPPTFAVQPLQFLIQHLCSAEQVDKKNVCERFFDFSFGFSGRQAPMSASLWASGLQAASVNELMQLGQFARTKRPCKFSFNTPQKNLERYNSREVPCYDLGRIKLPNMSFYVGAYDRLVSWADVNMTIAQLTVPTKLTVIRERGIYFNHLGFLLHSQANRLAIVPSLFDLEEAEHEHARELLEAKKRLPKQAGASNKAAHKKPLRNLAKKKQARNPLRRRTRSMKFNWEVDSVELSGNETTTCLPDGADGQKCIEREEEIRRRHSDGG